MLTDSGHFDTPNASKYLQQLCKHWSHKAVAEFDATQGSIAFDTSHRVEMKATDTQLEITAIAGPRADLERWKQVIADHLVRFAFREDLSVDWTTDETG